MVLVAELTGVVGWVLVVVGDALAFGLVRGGLASGALAFVALFTVLRAVDAVFDSC